MSYAGGKFSTSRKRGVFTDAALEKLFADLWRWWLCQRSGKFRTDVTVDRFVADANKDLATYSAISLTSILVFSRRHYDGRIPAGGPIWNG